MEMSKSRSHVVYTIAVIAFIFSLHIVIPAYSNSSFLSLFADENTVGLIYMAGAALSILIFILAPYVIRLYGNFRTIFALIIIEIIIFYGLVTTTSPLWLAILFIIQSATSLIIGYCLDIFLEGYSDGRKVGTIRGLYMTSINVAWVIGPLIGSILITDTDNYRNTYIASLAILFPLLYLVYRNFSRFHDPNYSHPSPWELTKKILSNSNLSRLLYANLILQIFFSWMVVYSPIYLNKIIGFDWKEIGIIIVIMLLPFILFEYPLGKLSDHKYGEKIIMAMGFGIMGLSTILISTISIKILLVWIIILFITRTGASMAEIMLETYLFKSIHAKDSNILSVFRISRPASFFFSSGIMIVGLNFVDTKHMFIVIGLLVLSALLPILTIEDIKKD